MFHQIATLCYLTNLVSKPQAAAHENNVAKGYIRRSPRLAEDAQATTAQTGGAHPFAQPGVGQGANPDHQIRRKTPEAFKKRKLKES